MAHGTRWPLWSALILVGVVVAILLGWLGVRTSALADQARSASSPPVPTPTARTGVATAAFIGDSYSAGTGSSGYNTKFTTLLAAYEGWSSMDFAYGGTGYLRTVKQNGSIGCGVSVCPRYSAVIEQVKKDDPTVVVVSGGRNDVTENPDDVVSAIAEFYRALHKALPHAVVYATSPIWDSRKPPAELAAIQSAVRKNVRAVGGTYLDVGEPLRGKPSLIADDGVHPNDKGHAALAQAVEVALSASMKSEPQ